VWSGPGGPLVVTSLVSTPMGVDGFIVSYFSCVFKWFLLDSEQFRRQVENVTTEYRIERKCLNCPPTPNLGGSSRFPLPQDWGT